MAVEIPIHVVWTLEEERLLNRAVKFYGPSPNWDLIADIVNSAPTSRYHQQRSRQQCLQHWAMLSASSSVRCQPSPGICLCPHTHTTITTQAPSHALPATSNIVSRPSFAILQLLQRSPHAKKKGSGGKIPYDEAPVSSSPSPIPIGPSHASHLQASLAVGALPSKPPRSPVQILALRSTKSSPSTPALRPYSSTTPVRIPVAIVRAYLTFPSRSSQGCTSTAAGQQDGTYVQAHHRSTSRSWDRFWRQPSPQHASIHQALHTRALSSVFSLCFFESSSLSSHPPTSPCFGTDISPS